MATTISLVAASADVRAVTSYDWPQFNGDARHSGNNTSETALSSVNVGKLQQLFEVTLPEVADSAPVVVSPVSTSGGSKDLLFVNTRQGRLMAFDAHTGATVWTFLHTASACSPSAPCITTSSPAIDPAAPAVPALPRPALWLAVAGLLLLTLHRTRHKRPGSTKSRTISRA